MRMEGYYTVYLDNQPINTNRFFFEKFWCPIVLTFNLGVLNLGNYNLTLVIADNSGQLTADSDQISIISSTIETKITSFTTTVDSSASGFAILISSSSLLCLLTIIRKKRKCH